MGGARRMAVALAGALLTAVCPAVGTAPPVAAATPPCGSGLVALTFDDGPQASVTPALLDVLAARRVPAAFFVVGERVTDSPSVTRRTSALGFTVGNQTYGHEDLTSLSDAGIARTLRRARRAIVAAGARPSGLMRPPFGSIDRRVRAVVAELGLVPVLWTIDPRDWAGGSPGAITRAVVSALRPRAENLVLLHDGVANSPNTLAAVPGIVRRARQAGYCFAAPGRGGHPRPPVPRVRVGEASVLEGAPGELTRVTVPVTLDRPTSLPTSVRVTSHGGTATSGTDFLPVDRVVRFPVGRTRGSVAVTVVGDARAEVDEQLTLRLSEPRGVRIADGTGTVRIRDDDPVTPEPVTRSR